jgi:exosortase A
MSLPRLKTVPSRSWSQPDSAVGVREMVLAAAACVAIVILFRGTVADLLEKWYTDASFNHCFLIVPICLYLLWRQRLEIAATEAQPDLRGIALVAIAALAWLLGHATGTLIVQELSLVAGLQAVILTMFGWPLFRKLAFPLAYLYLAVPFGQAFQPRLQSITAASAVEMLRAVGVPVFADGNLISIPTGSFDVAEECSGLRFLIASIALGTLFARIMYRSWARRAVFLGMSVILPILANGARAFGIILLAYGTNNELATGVDHIVYGWIFFTIITFMILLIGMSFRDTAPVPSVAIASPERSASATRILVAGLLALAPLSAAKLLGDHLDEVPALGAVRLAPPMPQPPWREAIGLSDPLQPIYVGADAELHTAYTTGSNRAYLHIGYFIRDRRGAQAVSSAHNFEGGNAWRAAAAGVTSAEVDGQSVSVRFTRSVRGGAGHLVWYWYWVDGQFTANPYIGKLLETKAKLLGGERASAVIAISADYVGDPSDAEKTLREFLSALRGLSARLSEAPGF